jgi:hypothetical protein
VLSWLAGAHRAAWQKLHQAGVSPDVPEPLNIEKLLSGSLQRRCPQFDPSTEEIEAFIEEILYQVSKRRGRRQRSVYGKEIFLTGLVSLLAVGLIWGVNRLLPGSEPTAGAGAARQSAVTPRPTIKPTPWRVLSFDYTSQGGESLASIAEKLDLQLSALVDPPSGLQITRDPAAKTLPGDVLEFRVRSDPANLPTSTPVQPVLYSQPTLNAQSSLEQVRSRIAQSESLWHTLWADVSFVFYGPQGYSGPALQTSRVWVWMQLPGQSLVKELAEGRYFTSPVLVKNGIGYDYSVFNKVSAAPQGNLLPVELGDLLLPSRSEWLKIGKPLRILRQDSFAGRQVIIVQWQTTPLVDASAQNPRYFYSSNYLGSLLFLLGGYHPSSLLLTVDAQTGVVLRLRQYSDANGHPTLIQEVVANEVAFDVNFSQPGLFDPRITGTLVDTVDYNGGPVTDHSGYEPASTAQGHEPMNRTIPPPGFDPSGEMLTFQYPPGSPGQSGSSNQEVDLFAGQYYLRSLKLAPIYSEFCTRSADGSRIAYLNDEYANYAGGVGSVQWLDLRQPAEIHAPLTKLEVSDLAFSPDAGYLAIAGIDPKSGSNGIYIVDTANSEVELLLPTFYTWDLLWSPDGKSVAFTGVVDTGGEFSAEKLAAVVVDVSSKEIVYLSEIPNEEAYYAFLTSPNQRNDWPPPDWPVYQWGTPFSVYRGMLGNCTQPPKRIPPPP